MPRDIPAFMKDSRTPSYQFHKSTQRIDVYALYFLFHRLSSKFYLELFVTLQIGSVSVYRDIAFCPTSLIDKILINVEIFHVITKSRKFFVHFYCIFRFFF